MPVYLSFLEFKKNLKNVKYKKYNGELSSRNSEANLRGELWWASSLDAPIFALLELKNIMKYERIK